MVKLIKSWPYECDLVPIWRNRSGTNLALADLAWRISAHLADLGRSGQIDLVIWPMLTLQAHVLVGKKKNVKQHCSRIVKTFKFRKLFSWDFK